MKQALVHISIVHFFALIATQGRDTEDERETEKRKRKMCSLLKLTMLLFCVQIGEGHLLHTLLGKPYKKVMTLQRR